MALWGPRGIGNDDDLDGQISEIDRELKDPGSEHRYIPLLVTVPGIAWVLGYTIASEIGDIHRFSSPINCAATPGCAHASTSPEAPTVGGTSPTPAPEIYAGH